MGRCNPNLFVLFPFLDLANDSSLISQPFFFLCLGTKTGRSACRSSEPGLLEMRVKDGSKFDMFFSSLCEEFIASTDPDLHTLRSPLKSSLLQTFVSIQGLVLVREPWFCEPASVLFLFPSPSLLSRRVADLLSARFFSSLFPQLREAPWNEGSYR